MLIVGVGGLTGRGAYVTVKGWVAVSISDGPSCNFAVTDPAIGAARAHRT